MTSTRSFLTQAGLQDPRHDRRLAIAATLSAVLGVLIHLMALIAGPGWFAFFGAPPAIVRSAENGTWLAPLATLAISVGMGLCGLYGASALGWMRRLPLLRLGLGVVAATCLLRAVAVVPLFVWRPVLLNTFEVVAALVWSLAGVGFVSAWRLARGR